MCNFPFDLKELTVFKEQRIWVKETYKLYHATPMWVFNAV